MIGKKSETFVRYLFLLATPVFTEAASYTWISTSDSNLNTAGNWMPSGGPPGPGDDAEFDSATSGVITSPVATPGVGFDVSTIDFVNLANVFTIAIPNGTLTFEGGGIGSAIPSSQTNATFRVPNVDNAAMLTNQILFNGNPSTSGSAVLSATNSGTTINSTASMAQISYITANQIFSPHPFSVQNGASLTATNEGTNHFNASSLNVGYVSNTQLRFDNTFNGTDVNNISLRISNQGTNSGSGNTNSIGYVGNPQFSVGDFTAGNDLSIFVANTGSEASTGSGSENIGYVGDNQLEFDAGLTVLNNATIQMANTGSLSSSVSGNNNNVGLISGNQLYVSSAVSAGNFLSMSAANTGSNSGSGSGSAGPSMVNATGVIQGQQYFIGGTFTAGTNASIAAANTGSDAGSGSFNQTGWIQGPQFSVTAAFQTGANNTIAIANTGEYTNSGSAGNNQVGYVSGDQLTFNAQATLGDQAVIAIANTGTSSGTNASNSSNQIGYLTGNQITVSSSFQTGNHLGLTVANIGTDSSEGSTNQVGIVNGYQCSFDNSFITGDNATIEVSNTGSMSGSATGHSVGTFGDGQFTVGTVFQAGDFLTLKVTNMGTDTTTTAVSNSIATNFAQQILVDSSFTVGANAVITALNKGVNSNSLATGSVGVLSGQDQFSCVGAFSAGENLTLAATNSAQGVGSAGTVGSCLNQLHFQNNCTFNNGSVISASNEGFGTVTGSQILFDQGFSVASGSITLQASNTGTVSGHGISIAASSGGDAIVVLANSSLDITSASSPFTIGGLNGDASSKAQSTPTLTIDTDAEVAAVFGGAIQMAPALIKTGAGSQTLSGANTIMGLTTVDGGALILNGSLPGNMLVNTAGTVKGTGTIGGTLTVDGAIAPGNSIGTLHVGTYIQNSGSSYNVEVNGAGQSDLIDVTGVATINGGTVVVSSADGTYSFASPYTILTAGGGRMGMYSDVTAISPMIVPGVTYDAMHVYLTLKPNILVAAKTFNERAVAIQLDSIDPTPLQNLLLSEIARLTLPEATKALDSLSGWQYTDQILIAETAHAQFLSRLYDPIRLIVTSDQKCSPCSNTTSCCDDWSVWTEAGGTFSKINGNANAHSFTLGGWEATGGIQKTLFCDWTIGLAGSFEQDFIHFTNRGGSELSNTLFAGLYSLYRPSYFYAFTDFVYGYSFNRMERFLNVGPLSYRATSKPNMSQFTFYGELGADWRAGAVLIQPFAGVEAGTYSRRSVTESFAGGWALHINKKSDSVLYSRIGLHLTAGRPSNTVLASLDLSWNKRWSGKATGVSEHFVYFGDDFNIKGVHLNSNSFYYALTFAKCVNEHWDLYIKGEGNVWNHAYQCDGVAGIQYSW